MKQRNSDTNEYNNDNYNYYTIIKITSLYFKKSKWLRSYFSGTVLILFASLFIWMYSIYPGITSMNTFYEDDITTSPTLQPHYFNTKKLNDSYNHTDLILNQYFNTSKNKIIDTEYDTLTNKTINIILNNDKIMNLSLMILKNIDNHDNFSVNDAMNLLINDMKSNEVDESSYYNEEVEEKQTENNDKIYNNFSEKSIHEQGLITATKTVTFTTINKENKTKTIKSENKETKENSSNDKEYKNNIKLEKEFERSTKNKRNRLKNTYDEKYRPWLRQIVKQKHIRQSRRNIFFIESSCGTVKLKKNHNPEEGLVLNPRQSCAIESTARINPKYKIFLFHTCQIHDAFYESSSNYVRELFFYSNFYLVEVNMDQLFNSTPLQDLWNNKAFEGSYYPLEHISDAMRLLILWKYGGTYLDLDVVTMRPLTPLKSNFAGVQDDDTIANGVLNFEPNGFAHNLLTTCLENFREWFDGKEWSGNGPILLTNALLEFCQVSEVVQAMKSRCGGFHVYPPSVFYPIHFSGWESLLDEGEGERIMKQIENSTIVHMWNHLSRDGYVLHGSNQAFSLLADKYCPKVYQEVGPNFRR